MTETAESLPKTTCGQYLPTPAEIAAGCLEIQRGWSPAEREKRACKGFAAERWELPGEHVGVTVKPENSELYD